MRVMAQSGCSEPELCKHIYNNLNNTDLTGEYEDRNFVVTRGDSRIAMTIARNSMTSRFGRDDRFLIDDKNSETKIAYYLTKPLKIGSVYNDEGVYKFVLQETQTTDNDNQQMGIADYYKHFPKKPNNNSQNNSQNSSNSSGGSDDTERKVWI